MASCGSCAPALPGGIYPSAMAPGPRRPAASPGGTRPALGSASVRRCKPRPRLRASSTGRCIPLMAPRSGRLSLRRGQNKGPGGRSARAEPGWVQPHSAWARGRWWQAHHLPPDTGPAARRQRIELAHGARSRGAGRADFGGDRIASSGTKDTAAESSAGSSPGTRDGLPPHGTATHGALAPGIAPSTGHATG